MEQAHVAHGGAAGVRFVYVDGRVEFTLFKRRPHGQQVWIRYPERNSGDRAAKHSQVLSPRSTDSTLAIFLPYLAMTESQLSKTATRFLHRAKKYLRHPRSSTSAASFRSGLRSRSSGLEMC